MDISNKNNSVMESGHTLFKPAGYAGFLVILLLLPIFIKSSYWLHTFIIAFIYIIGSSSLRLIMTSGQMPLAHAAFMGIGAYSSAVLAKWLGFPVWITIPIGACVAMGIGIFIAYPFARLRSLYYAMVSLFFGTGVLQVIVVLGIWTGGEAGLSGIPTLFTSAPKVAYYYFFLVLTLVSLLILYRLEFSRLGVNWKAIDQSYLVAASIGINEGRQRVFVLGVGCFFAGLAGATYAHYNAVLSLTAFDLLATLWIVIYVLIGGEKRFAGPMIGTFLLIFIPEIFRGLKQFSPYLSAVLLLVVIYLSPEGITSLPSQIWARYKERRNLEKENNAS